MTPAALPTQPYDAFDGPFGDRLLVSLTAINGDMRVHVATTIGAGGFHALTFSYPEDPGNEGMALLRAFLTTVRLGD